jgi:hypothetical protein
MIDRNNERFDYTTRSVTCDCGDRLIDRVRARLLSFSLAEEWN